MCLAFCLTWSGDEAIAAWNGCSDRVDGALPWLTEGHGRGLAIVKTLVECMDGNLRVRSKLDDGNVLAIVLPTQLQRN